MRDIHVEELGSVAVEVAVEIYSVKLELQESLIDLGALLSLVLCSNVYLPVDPGVRSKHRAAGSLMA